MKYETRVPLGRGAMGEVYKAYDPALRRFVALKYLRWDDPAQVERFLREARLQARVDHERVCKVYEVGTDDGRPFIAMQFIEGRTLDEAATEMSLEDKVRVTRDVAEAVHAAHETGLIHRDLKPQNIMVEKAGDRWKPHVMDFGLAREEEASRMTETGAMVGTPAYMAPEQARGDVRGLDRRTDVYGLGAVLYRLLAGRPVFEGSDLDVVLKVAHEEPTPPRRLDPSLPQALENVTLKCLEKDPARRYATAEALARDLGRFLEGEPIQARPASLAYRVGRRIRRNRTLAAVIALALAASLFFGAVALKSRRDQGQRAAAAQRFGEQAQRIEAMLRQAYLLPLHDIRAEKTLVRARMKLVETQMAAMGSAAEGPGRYALGRGHLAFREHDKARQELEAAWRTGYRTPELAHSLGLALGALYQRALDEAQRIDNRGLREARIAQIEKSLRDPALEYLRTARGETVETPIYVEGVIALYEKRYDEALDKARQAFRQAPWLYEAQQLEGEAGARKGRDRLWAGDYAQAQQAYEGAQAAYRAASTIARSDVAVYAGEASTWLGLMDLKGRMGQPVDDVFKAALEACDRALQADPESAEAHSEKSAVLWRRGEQEWNHGGEPGTLFQHSLDSAREAVRWGPESSGAHLSRGTAAAILSQYELSHGADPSPFFVEAIASLDKTLALNPARDEVLSKLGNVYINRAEHERREGKDPRDSLAKAARTLEKAVEISPGYSFHRNNLSLAYKGQAEYERDTGGDARPAFERAERSLRKATELDPKNALAYANLGIVLTLKAAQQVDHASDPSAELAGARSAWQAASSINKALAPWASAYVGQIELIAARWAIQRGDSPETSFTNARTALDACRDVPDAEPQEATADLYRWLADWQLRQRRSAQDSIRRGLSAADKALSLNPKAARAVALRGALQLLQARSSAASEDRRRLAGLAVASLEKSFGLDVLLKREFGPVLAEAQGLTPRAVPLKP